MTSQREKKLFFSNYMGGGHGPFWLGGGYAHVWPVKAELFYQRLSQFKLRLLLLKF